VFFILKGRLSSHCKRDVNRHVRGISMKIDMNRIILSFFFSLLLPLVAFGQGQEKSVFAESMSDFYVVAGTTVGGAVLGLSTLSFVEEPGDHLKNVVVGGAIGMILGVGIVAYSQATKSRESFYKEQGAQLLPPASPFKHVSKYEPKPAPIYLTWGWQF
jgi:hypothetical protein